MKSVNFGRSLALAIFLVPSLSFAATAPANKESGKLSESAGSTEFLAIGHPSALKVVGKGASPKGNLLLESGKLSGAATFDMESLDTGIRVRNEHMKTKYLETGKYPLASLKILRLVAPAISAAGDFEIAAAPFEGALTLHGVEKPVRGTAEIKKIGTLLNLVVHFGLKISDFKIAAPGYAGISMADEVQVTVKDSAALVAVK